VVKNLQITSVEKNVIKKGRIHQIIGSLKKEMSFDVSSLTINFISREEIKRINIKYLDHNYSTDIITFNYSGSHKDLDGEIFISLPDAEENAKKFNVSFNNEIVRLVIHGILHLIGYNDTNTTDKKKMKQLEDSLVKEHVSFY
jgi:probable rRNA maturation factor